MQAHLCRFSYMSVIFLHISRIFLHVSRKNLHINYIFLHINCKNLCINYIFYISIEKITFHFLLSYSKNSSSCKFSASTLMRNKNACSNICYIISNIRLIINSFTYTDYVNRMHNYYSRNYMSM
jgi:hypothetical protein